MSRYLYRSGQLDLLSDLKRGPLYLSDLAHLHRPGDRIACLHKVLRGTGLRIVGRWVRRKGKLGMMVKDREYRLVRDDD